MKHSNEIIILRPSGVKVKQVNKTKARRMFNEGKELYMIPCNMRLNSPWGGPCRIVPKVFDNTFEQAVNVFEYYNCNAETGKYANFFVEVD